MIIYVILIGSLLAITIGHIIGRRDRKAGVVRILFSKPITKKDFLSGKVLAILSVLLIVTVASAIISSFSVSLFSRISLALVIKIIEFYSISFIYLSGFALIGLSFALMKKNSAVALLIPIIIWIAITFALPELSSALYPTSSLNPVLPQTDVLQSPVLATIHNIFYPLSISEHYKQVASKILGIQQTPATVNPIKYSPPLHIMILSAWFIIAFAAAVYSISRFDTSLGDHYE
ncbi:MAG: ABC transporter permease subunit [Nitrospiraceae bacterium]|nr:ABC transporter permease subunit [Nitrospiraceae bacterium]